jgi:hypothetical protein
MERCKFLCRIAVWVALGIALPAFAQDGTTLQVHIDGQALQGAVSSNQLTVTIRNVSDHPVYLPRHRTPLFTPDGHLMGNVFEVTDQQGRPATFIGRYVRISPVNPSHFFVRIDPGQMLSHHLDLAADYDLTAGGRYRVRYSQDFVRTIETDASGEIANSSDAVEVSNTEEIVADKGMALLKRNEASAIGIGATCTANQMNIVAAARGAAPGLTMKALHALEGLFEVKEGKDDVGNKTYTGQIRADNAYTYWFGLPENRGQAYLSRPSYTNYWKDNDDFVMIKSVNAIYLRVGAESYLCGCSSEYSPETAAWTNTSNSTINLCDRFFALPGSNGPYDSKLLTLVHEYSHFVDWRESSTGDYAYGMSGAHNLTTKNRKNAVRNADNVTYYVGTFNALVQP